MAGRMRPMLASCRGRDLCNEDGPRDKSSGRYGPIISRMRTREAVISANGLVSNFMPGRKKSIGGGGSSPGIASHEQYLQAGPRFPRRFGDLPAI